MIRIRPGAGLQHIDRLRTTNSLCQNHLRVVVSVFSINSLSSNKQNFAGYNSSICNNTHLRVLHQNQSLQSRLFSTLPPKEDVENPTWITDTTGTIKERDRKELSSVIQELFEKYGVELSIVVEPEVGDLRKTPRERGIELFNKWGIGSKERNNGILIYMSLAQRRIEIIVGKGLNHVMPPEMVAAALENRVVPMIQKQGRSAGIVEASNVCADAIWRRSRIEKGASWIHKSDQSLGPALNQNETLTGVNSCSNGGRSHYDNRYEQQSNKRGRVLGFVTLVAAFLFGSYKWNERQVKKCEKCSHYPMDEIEGHHIPEESRTECERVELEIGSVRYRFFKCPQCSSEKQVKQNVDLAKFKRCQHCNCRSVTVEPPIVIGIGASEKSGMELVKSQCHICHRKQESMRMRSSPGSTSSSSSDTGTQHGGGTSSGGGAGASF